MAPKNDVSAARREQILNAAEKVFARQGFDKARMDDIVAESRLSKGALYWYFKSKDEIILGLLDRVFAGDLRAAESLVDAEGTAAERLLVFARTAIAEIRRFEPLMPMGYEFFALAARHKTVRRYIRAYYQRYRDILARIVEQGVRSGEFEPVEPESAALVLIGHVEGLALLWFLEPAWVDWDSLGDFPVMVVLDGLRARGR